MPQTYRLSGLIPDLLRENEAARQAAVDGKPRGPVTGIPKIDRDLGGALPPGLTILQGAPGVGKTALGLQVSATCGFPSLYVSAEMTPLVLFRRLIARQGKVFLSVLNSGELETSQLRSVAEMVAYSLPDIGILDATLEPVGKEMIVEAARGLLEAADASGLLIVIDALQTWARAGPMGGANDYEIITLGVHSARSLATELGCPVLLVSHRSRAGQAGGGLHASKGTGDVEYQAEAVLELDGKPVVDAAGEIALTLAILKNRHGACGGVVPLRFSGRLQSFRDVSGTPVSMDPGEFRPGRRGGS